MAVSPTEQRDQALALANQIRTDKAKLKARITSLGYATGAAMAAALVDDRHNDIAGAFSVREIIRCVPKLGDVAVHEAVKHCGIRTADRKLRDLTDRQRDELAHVLRNRKVLFPHSHFRDAA